MSIESLPEFSPAEKRENEKIGFKDSIRKIYAADRTVALHREQILEMATGIKPLSDEEKRQLLICREALSELWFNHELGLTVDHNFVAGRNFKSPELEETTTQTTL